MPLPRVGFHWARRISIALANHSLDPRPYEFSGRGLCLAIQAEQEGVGFH